MTIPFKDVSQRYFFLINIATFKGVWAIGVLGQGSITALGMALLGMHFYLSPSRMKDLKVMAAVASIGIALDLLLTRFGIFVFQDVFFPLWLALIWMAFALVFNHSCVWLQRLPLAIQGLIGGLGGAASYYFGHQLGAVEFGYPLPLTLAVISAIWCLALPLFCAISGSVRDE